MSRFGKKGVDILTLVLLLLWSLTGAVVCVSVCARVCACVCVCVRVYVYLEASNFVLVLRLFFATHKKETPCCGWIKKGSLIEHWSLAVRGHIWTREWYMIVIMNSLNWPTFLYKYIKIYDCRVLITYRYFFYDYYYYY